MLTEMRYLILLILCTGCTQRLGSTALKHSGNWEERPLVFLAHLEDHVGNALSHHSARNIYCSVEKRLQQKNKIYIAPSEKGPRQFEVSLKLIQQNETIQSPNEITLGIHLHIEDLREEQPRTILQEVLSARGFLEKPFADLSKDDLLGEKFSVSPLGLTHAKIARDIATRIEDYILLALKGK